MKKSYQEHLNYLYSIIKLKLWFVWNWKRNNPQETIKSILRKRVDVYRKTDINKEGMNPSRVNFECSDWVNLESKLECLFNKYSLESSGSGFEQEAFEVIKPYIDLRAVRDYKERPYVLDYQCGSLKYDKPRGENPKRVFFHIANAISPKSIFSDSTYLHKCFCKLMDKSSQEYGADSFETWTWLNSYPKWLNLFPPEWIQNMGPLETDIQWHFGFWGQFITARGTFNEKLGTQLRNTGKFPFLPRHSWCHFSSMRQHIQRDT